MSAMSEYKKKIYDEHDQYSDGLFEQEILGILVFTKKGKVLNCNNLFSQFMEIEKSKIMNNSIFELLQISERSELSNIKLNLLALIGLKKKSFSFEKKIVKTNQTEINILIQCFIPQNKSEEKEQIVCFVQDISEYKKKKQSCSAYTENLRR